MNRLASQTDSTRSMADTDPDQMSHISIFVTADVAPGVAKALSEQGVQTRAYDPETVADGLARSAEVSGDAALPCVLLWDAPLRRLVEAICQGASPEAVLAEWREQAGTLMALLRRNRRRLLLVDAHTLTAPDAGPEQAMLRDRLSSPDLRLPVAAPVADGDASAALPRILGQLFIARSDDVREILDELQASGIAPPADGIEIDALIGAASEFVQLSGLRQETASLQDQLAAQADTLQKSVQATEAQRAETTAAKDALRLSQGQAAAQAQELQKAVQAAEAQRGETAAAQDALHLLHGQFAAQARDLQEAIRATGKQRAERGAAREELRLLRGQFALQALELQKAAQARVDLYVEADARRVLQRQCDMLKERVEDLLGKLDAVFGSTSWRVTGPMRGIKRRITRDGESIDMLMARENPDRSGE